MGNREIAVRFIAGAREFPPPHSEELKKSRRLQRDNSPASSAEVQRDGA